MKKAHKTIKKAQLELRKSATLMVRRESEAKVEITEAGMPQADGTYKWDGKGRFRNENGQGCWIRFNYDPEEMRWELLDSIKDGRVVYYGPILQKQDQGQ